MMCAITQCRGPRDADPRPHHRRAVLPAPRAAAFPAGAALHPVVQAKLKVGAPNDKYEREADWVAGQVMRMPEPQLRRACLCDGCLPEGQREQPGQKYESVGARRVQTSDMGQIAAPPIVNEVLAAPGQPLDPATRGFMEQRFGNDFSRVRVHADARASESARAINARAYTLGRNVVFGAGQFVPGTRAGKSLLAHELTHVLHQGVQSKVLQRQPDEKAQNTGDLVLPWKHGDYSLFEKTSAGIRFLVGVSSSKESDFRATIPAIGKRMSSDNSRIKEPADRVMTCFIVPTTTRFALWAGKPTLMLDPADADEETTAHEMGHAIFHALESQAKLKTKDGARAGNLRLRVADIYARLSQTNDVTEDNETHPAGLWIVDPSQWVPGGAKEHPWQDPDEFFASAKVAYQFNRKGFKSAIARLKKLDPAVEGPAKELLALLDAFFKKGELPSRGVPPARATAARQELERATGVSKVEDTVMSDTPLDWLLNPKARPKQLKARPSLDSPY